MTLTVPVHPETEASLRHLAEKAGKDLTSYVAELIEGAVARGGGNSIDSGGDFDNALDELFSADTRKLPSIPLTYSRDDIYSDHD